MKIFLIIILIILLITALVMACLAFSKIFKNNGERFGAKNLRSGEHKFAVVLATYKRKNGSSYKNLLRVHKFLMNQTYKNFKIFLVGDDYEDHEEFNKIISMFPKEKIFSYNNNESYRNGVFKLRSNTWCAGGLLAITIGVEQALKENFNYYLHLDDDDIWTNNHIEVINNTINKFPEVDFIVNKAKYQNSFLPSEFKTKSPKVEYNNFIPKPANSVHSSWTINLHTIGDEILKLHNEWVDRINQIKNNEIKEYDLTPFDASVLQYLNELQSQKKIKCIFIPECTVQKDTDGNTPL